MKRHFLALDGLRGIAAFAVMFMHGLGIFWPGGFSIPAALAVDFFFMLSGFVLAYAYGERLERGLSWRRFMAQRLIRLYPVIFLGVMLGAAVSFAKQWQQGITIAEEGLPELVATLFILPAGLPYSGLFFDGPSMFSFDGPMWSLFFEIAASAAFATAVRRSANLPALLAISAILIAGSIWHGTVGEFGTRGWVGFAFGFPRVAVPFAIGVTLYRSGAWQRFGVPFPLTAGALALLLLVPMRTVWPYDLACIFLLFPALIVVGAQGLGGWICVWLGRLSYPVYLLHFPIFRIVGFVVKGYFPNPFALIALSIAATVLGSWLALVLYDEPVRRKLNRKIVHAP
ncbi:MAG: hypothetical protein JWN69_2531 [Alphaproteobacteria bacterium]|nr:hypothetical protein [Alphaproteobacteria bacterium]